MSFYFAKSSLLNLSFVAVLLMLFVSTDADQHEFRLYKDEKNQILETNVWLQFEWTDYKLKWDPANYGNIHDVRFPAKGKIWKPDVLLYNSADSNFDTLYPSNLVVYNSGTVNWIPPGILKSSCKIDITWFPFDDQTCFLKFGSWTYHGLAMDLKPKKGWDTSEYLTNGEWTLLATPVDRIEKFYDCCPEPYPSLQFYIHIRRRTLYYGFNLIIPSLLISLMTVLGFTLPPDAGEKITLEITILLSVCFFLSIVADMSPPTSEAVPLIGTFFSCCMMVVSASVVFTVVVLNLHYRTPDTHEMSPFVRSVLLNWLPWILMMKRPGHVFTKDSVMEAFQKEKKKDKDKKERESESLMRNVRSVEEGDKESNNNHLLYLKKLSAHSSKESGMNLAGGLGAMAGKTSALVQQIAVHRRESVNMEQRVNDCLQPLLSTPGAIDSGVHAMILMMQRIHMELKFVTRRMEKEDEDEDAQNDWQFAAMVVDRLCLFVFSIFIVASTCGIMFSAPNLQIGTTDNFNSTYIYVPK